MAQHLVLDGLGRDVAGQDDHADAALEDRRLQGELGDAGHLAGGGDQGAVVRAAGEDRLGVGLLEVAAADLGAGDVGGDGEDRRRVALAVVQPVDQVQAARARTTRAPRSGGRRSVRRRRRRRRRPPRCARGRTRCRTRAGAGRRRSGSPSRRRCRTPSGSRPRPSGRPRSPPRSGPCAAPVFGPAPLLSAGSGGTRASTSPRGRPRSGRRPRPARCPAPWRR